MIKQILSIFLVSLFFSLQAQTTLDTAQNFSIKDTQGNSFKLFDILDAGKIVVIDFFSTA